MREREREREKEGEKERERQRERERERKKEKGRDWQIHTHHREIIAQLGYNSAHIVLPPPLSP